MPIILLAPFNVYAKIINMDPKSSPTPTPEPDQGSASSNGGIIASTPDIATPPTEEQIAAARKARGDMPSGSVVMGANEGTSREGRAFLASHPHRSQASGTGDIILRNGPTPGGKKKWILLGLAAIAFVAIIIVLIGVVGKKTTTGQFETSFKRYSNYLLYGEDKGSTLEGEYDDERSYELDLQLEGDTYDENYWQTSRDLLSSAIESYDNSDSSEIEVVDYFETYRSTFDFVELYKRNGEPTLDGMAADSLTQTTLEEKYAAFLDSNNADAVAYVQNRISQYTTWAELYGVYDNLGCVNEGNVDEESCVISASDEDTIDDLATKIAEFDQSATQLLSGAIYMLKSDCWYFDEIIQTGAEEASDEDDSDEGDNESADDLGNETVFDYSGEADTYDEATYDEKFSDAWAGNMTGDDNE